eukprot:scaffold54434_cov54-Attheya_sp.AAC.2
MTRSSAIWVNDVEANDLGDDKLTSSRAIAFDERRDDDDEDFFDVETVSFLWQQLDLVMSRVQKDSRDFSCDFMPRSLHYFPSHLSPGNEREKERKKRRDRDRDTTFDKKYFDEGIHCNTTEDEKKNQKRKSGRKKPFSCSQLLPLGVAATICDCIAKMPLPCDSKKLGANLSEAEKEYVRITHVIAME